MYIMYYARIHTQYNRTPQSPIYSRMRCFMSPSQY